MKLLMFEMNHHTRPVTVIVREDTYPKSQEGCRLRKSRGIGKAEDG